MVARCGCTDPIVFGHGRACELDLGPVVAGGTVVSGDWGMPAMTAEYEPVNTAETARHWYDRVIEWAERFDRRYSELKRTEMEMSGRVL